MDLMSLLKTVPAVIGIAGLLTNLTRARPPVSGARECRATRAQHLFAPFCCSGARH
jgi:hypothetical protein